MFKRVVVPLLVLLLLAALYLFVITRWSYSSGERAGWVQKLSNKGWVCKTWEGELSMVSMPGATPEKFAFTVTDDAVAERITKAMGKRVSLHYNQKVGLPGSCFGETRYYVDNISVSDEIPLTPGVVVPSAPAAAPPPAAAPASR
jgi:hypothetical protein